ncbi:S-layer homology domain-containing protein [Bernardetia sp. MNP-M8]|uniref:S-layer homology domain-containing protein n=1 Tax=Bernardetia sp. MNP-M8 TaxID=3127470 RepID=UPI0030D11010
MNTKVKITFALVLIVLLIGMGFSFLKKSSAFSIFTKNGIEATDDNAQKQEAQRLSAYLKMSVEQRKALPKQDRPKEAMLRDFEMTKDPALGYVPSQRRIQVFKEVQEMSRTRRLAKAIAGTTWTERGPNNIGGRTRTIMFDPNDGNRKKVWAGAVSGGLWYNNDITNATSQWQNINDFWANLAVTSIAYDPSNTQIMYAGTGEGFFNVDAVRGAGIWKTSDGGQTWNQLASTNNSNFHYIQKIAITPGGSVFVATRTGVFRSQDKGSSWSFLVSGNASDIEITSNGTVYAATGIFSTGIVRKSTNFGQDWTIVTPATGGQRIELAVAPSDNNVIYAVASGSNNSVAWFRKSTDGGSSWSNVTIPSYLEQNCQIGTNDFTRGQAWYDLSLVVHPTNPNSVIVGGIDLHRTTDAGSTWQLISYWTGGCNKPFVHADQHTITFRPQDSNVALFGHDGGVSYSSNIWNTNPTFATRNNGYNVTQFYGIATSSVANSNYMLAGAQDNGTIKINSSGISGGVTASGGDGGFPHIDKDNPSFQITSFTNNNYSISKDAGSSFNFVVGNNSGRFINPTDYDDNTNILYSASGSNQYMRINNLTNAINTITLTNVAVNALAGTQISAIKVSPYTDNRIFVADDAGKVIRIDNAHTNSPTILTISKSNIPFGYISCIELGTSDNEILITLSNYGVASVFETTNGGTSWVNKEANLPDFPVRWALYNPNNTNEVLLATETGVWSSDNFKSANLTWGLSSAGLANVRCDMLVYKESDRTVAVATHGRGIFTSDVFKTIPIPADVVGNWAENEIRYMINNAFMAGYSDGTFKPDNFLTRAEFATMIVKVINPPISSNPTIANRSFTDISGHWAEQNILKAARAGYLSGYPDGTFLPNDKITKMQVNLSISNGLGLSGGTSSMLNLFTDKADIPAWATTSISNAVGNRFVANHSDKNYYRPNWSSTRANAVVVMYQALRYLNRAPELYNFYIVVPSNPVSKIAAITQDNKNFEVTVYPNPVQNELRFNIFSKNPIEYVIYEVALGKVVKQGTLDSSRKVDVSTLTSGIYIVKVSVDGITHTKKIVKS